VKISSRTAGAHRAWLAASISLFSRNAGAFDATHERMFLFLLPVDQAVLRAIDRSRRFPQQRQALVEAVNSCTTIQQACKVIAEKLRSTFGWQQVCVYRVDYAAGKLRLSSVSSAKPEGTRPPEHSQSIKAGILGRAVESKQIDKVDDAENDADYVKAPHQENVGSVLCCPIVFEEEGAGRVVRFVIDVDDRHENAFSSDDEEDLNGLMPELANSLQRISKIQYLQLCFERSSDAIIVTDSYFNVRGANDAALKLLGAQDATGLSGSIAARFQNRAQFEVLARLPEGDLGDLVMVPVDDKLPHVPVFVARQDFPDSLGGSVFIARDTRTIRRSLELELLSDAAYEVAIETSTPLSLALDQLETLATLSSQDTRLRLLKILRQLKRVKHAYDKLALFNERARPAEDASFCAVDLCMELESICKELTDEQMELVAPISAPASLVVRGDPYQISTVFETLLSALIRTIPENQKVGVSLRAADGSALVSFIGKLPPDAGRSDRGRRAHEARMELQVAHPLLESFMRNHGGEISRNSLSDGREEFTLKFPLGVNDDKTHFSRVQPAGS
jgi:signal transduction histidine kinase